MIRCESLCAVIISVAAYASRVETGTKDSSGCLRDSKCSNRIPPLQAPAGAKADDSHVTVRHGPRFSHHKIHLYKLQVQANERCAEDGTKA